MTSPRFHILTLVLTPVLLLVVASCGEMDPEADPRIAQGSEPSGRILFASNGDIHMWDGSTEQLTNLGDASSPDWGADGQQYVFVRTGDAYSDLAVGNAETGHVENLTNNEPGFTPGTPEYLSRVVWMLDPTWASNGSGIAYVGDAGTDSNFLWFQPGLNNNPWRVPCSQRRNDNVERPDFSPDGSQVVFAQRFNNQEGLERWMDLRICDLNTDELTELTDGEPGQTSYFPRWSPDGEWIAFARRTNGATDIWVIPADGGEAVQLTELGDVTSPEWSPDGSKIAFLDPDGASFRAQYVDFNVDDSGTPTASEPHDLFNADRIDAPSGLSWTE